MHEALVMPTLDGDCRRIWNWRFFNFHFPRRACPFIGYQSLEAIIRVLLIVDAASRPIMIVLVVLLFTQSELIKSVSPQVAKLGIIC